jgi:RimJ/RimL family protein N-acetyltransferase
VRWSSPTPTTSSVASTGGAGSPARRRRAIDFAFEDLGLHRLEADTHPDNAASLRSLERLGFRREGLLRER